MRVLNAIIQPFKLDDVHGALQDIGIDAITIQEVKGCGRNRGHNEVYRGPEYVCNYLPKVHIMVLISDEELEQAKRVIIESSRTGKIGDGILWDTQIDGYTRIRTGEEVKDS